MITNILAVVALAQAPAADTSSFVDVVSPILERLEFPARLGTKPVHFDIRAGIEALEPTSIFDDRTRVVRGPDMANALSRLRSLSDFGDRLRDSSNREVVSCQYSTSDWPRCSVDDGGIAVSFARAAKVEGSNEISVVVQVRWSDENLRLTGYDLEVFVARRDAERTAGWVVTRTGVAIVL